MCWLCGSRACGIGIGEVKWNRGDYKWLCEECVKIAENIKETAYAKLDILELEALQGGVDAVGDYLEEIGITDLAHMDELDARLIVKAAWQGSVKRLRKLVKESVT